MMDPHPSQDDLLTRSPNLPISRPQSNFSRTPARSSPSEHVESLFTQQPDRLHHHHHHRHYRPNNARLPYPDPLPHFRLPRCGASPPTRRNPDVRPTPRPIREQHPLASVHVARRARGHVSETICYCSGSGRRRQHRQQPRTLSGTTGAGAAAATASAARLGEHPVVRTCCFRR